MYECIRIYAERQGAERIAAVLIIEESLRAARNAYNNDASITEVLVDEEGRYPLEDGYLGPDHQNWLLSLDLHKPQPDAEKAEEHRQSILEAMGAVGLLDPEIQKTG